MRRHLADGLTWLMFGLQMVGCMALLVWMGAPWPLAVPGALVVAFVVDRAWLWVVRRREE
jgi:hypothetical protein